MTRQDSSANTMSYSQSNEAKSGIVFGRERNGLTNAELELVSGIIQVPTFEHFPVLNLAQAVNVIGYELWTQKLSLELEDQSLSRCRTAATINPLGGICPNDDIATSENIKKFMDRLDNCLHCNARRASSECAAASDHAVAQIKDKMIENIEETAPLRPTTLDRIAMNKLVARMTLQRVRFTYFVYNIMLTFT